MSQFPVGSQYPVLRKAATADWKGQIAEVSGQLEYMLEYLEYMEEDERNTWDANRPLPHFSYQHDQARDSRIQNPRLGIWMTQIQSNGTCVIQICLNFGGSPHGHGYQGYDTNYDTSFRAVSRLTIS